MSDDHLLVRLETLALIAVGGFAGSNLRLLVLGELTAVQAVLLVNALGSAVLGLLLYEARYSGRLGRRAQLVLTTGFLSSVTTYSTFAIQTATADSPVLALGIVAGNYGFGFAGVLLGRALARRIGGVDA